MNKGQLSAIEEGVIESKMGTEERMSPQMVWGIPSPETLSGEELLNAFLSALDQDMESSFPNSRDNFHLSIITAIAEESSYAKKGELENTLRGILSELADFDLSTRKNKWGHLLSTFAQNSLVCAAGLLSHLEILWGALQNKRPGCFEEWCKFYLCNEVDRAIFSFSPLLHHWTNMEGDPYEVHRANCIRQVARSLGVPIKLSEDVHVLTDGIPPWIEERIRTFFLNAVSVEALLEGVIQSFLEVHSYFFEKIDGDYLKFRADGAAECGESFQAALADLMNRPLSEMEFQSFYIWSDSGMEAWLNYRLLLETLMKRIFLLEESKVFSTNSALQARFNESREKISVDSLISAPGEVVKQLHSNLTTISFKKNEMARLKIGLSLHKSDQLAEGKEEWKENAGIQRIQKWIQLYETFEKYCRGYSIRQYRNFVRQITEEGGLLDDYGSREEISIFCEGLLKTNRPEILYCLLKGSSPLLDLSSLSSSFSPEVSSPVFLYFSIEYGLWEVMGNHRLFFSITFPLNLPAITQKACLKGYIEVLRGFHNRGLLALPCIRDYIVLACQNGHLEVMKYLLEIEEANIEGANIDSPDPYGKTLLHHACWGGHLEVVKYLIMNGSNQEGATNTGHRPLHCASRNNHLKVVDYLINQGVEKEALVEDGRTALHIACQYGHLEVVKRLVAAGCNKEAQKLDLLTPLHLASMNGWIEVVKYLVAEGANKEAASNDLTPLLLACYQGHIEIVKHLINVGGDIKAKTQDGRTMLHLACITGKKEIIVYLLELGANMEEKDHTGKTPFMLLQKKHPELIGQIQFGSRDTPSSTAQVVFASGNGPAATSGSDAKPG